MNDTVWIKVHEHKSNITLRQNSHIKGTVLLLLFYISVAVGSSIMNISK